MQRAALYIRVSTEEQARHGLSLEDQKNSLTQFSKSHGMKIVGIYEDAGISARKPYKKRPALLKLLDDCRVGKIDLILFIKLDRWFRNVGNYYAVQEILDQYGVSWQATQEDYETTTASGRLKVNIMLSVAQDEADRTSERIKFVFEGKRARLEPLTGNIPFGYKIEGKAFKKDESKEALVNDFFKKYLASGSISKTSEFIREKYGISMRYHLIDKMLRSTTYYGKYYNMDGMCPAYITKEDHEKIQAMRRKVVRKAKNNRTYLFSGLVVCPECGNRMGARINTKQTYVFYNCNGHYTKQNGCQNRVNLGERKIEEYLLATVDNKFHEYKANFSALKNAEINKRARAEISAAKSKLNKLKDLYLNDIITLEELKADRESLLAKISDLEKAALPEQKQDFESIDRVLIENWKESYDGLNREEKREFWRIIIKEIKIYPDRHIEYSLNV